MEVAEGYYLGHIVYHLHRTQLLEGLADGRTAEELAAELGYDAELLRTLLEYVRQRTDIVVRDGRDGYALNSEYAPYHRLGFHLDKLIGAYGVPVQQLQESLRSPVLGQDLVDERMLAEAFAGVGSAGVAIEALILREWNIGRLVDLGCGPGSLLLELASRDPEFRGWGIDSNAGMCGAAAQRVAAAGLEHAVSIVHGDVREIAGLLGEEERRRVDGLHCRSLMNEFFSRGPGEATEFLVHLARLFSGRLLLIGDYYGKLGFEEDVSDSHAHTLLQDLAQAISGQGIPPPDLARWAEVYTRAGAELLHAYEGEQGGIAWFVHVLRL